MSVFIFEALHDLATRNLQSILTPYTHSYTQISEIPLKCGSQSRPMHKTDGEHAFSYAAPATYNKLPADIVELKSLTTFKVKLKTHLFNHLLSITLFDKYVKSTPTTHSDTPTETERLLTPLYL